MKKLLTELSVLAGEWLIESYRHDAEVARINSEIGNCGYIPNEERDMHIVESERLVKCAEQLIELSDRLRVVLE